MSFSRFDMYIYNPEVLYYDNQFITYFLPQHISDLVLEYQHLGVRIDRIN